MIDAIIGQDGKTYRKDMVFHLMKADGSKMVSSGSALCVGFVSSGIGIFKRAGETEPIMYFMAYAQLIPDAWMCDCGLITKLSYCPACAGSDM